MQRAFILGFLFTACATSAATTKPPVAVPAAWQTPVTAPAGPAELDRWWQAFQDPVLTELIAAAVTASPDLQAAEARLRQSRARRAGAAAGRYPSLTANGSARRTRTFGDAGAANATLYDAGLDATWELDLFGGVRNRVRAADADLAASQERLHDVQVSLFAEVAADYVDVRALQARLQIARDNLASQTETLQITEWRTRAGLVNEQDFQQARANLEQTRAQVPALEQQLVETEHALDILLGGTPGTLRPRLGTYGEIPSAPAAVAVRIPADTLRQRPDVRAAERQLAAEAARVGVTRAALYPTLRLSGSLGLEALTLGALGDKATASLLGGITAPLFEGGRLRADVAAQEAVRDETLVNYRQTVLNALREVENALAAVAHNRARQAALAEAAVAARAAALLARQRYAAGLSDFQSVLDTDRTVLSIEDSHAAARADGALALIRLYKAMGGGWTKEESP